MTPCCPLLGRPRGLCRVTATPFILCGLPQSAIQSRQRQATTKGDFQVRCLIDGQPMPSRDFKEQRGVVPVVDRDAQVEAVG